MSRKNQISEYRRPDSNMALSENKSEVLEFKTTTYVCWTELSLPNTRTCLIEVNDLGYNPLQLCVFPRICCDS